MLRGEKMFAVSSDSDSGLKRRRGQTAIEYLLVTASLLFVFVMMYRALQYSVANQFKRGGMVIMKVYVEAP